MEGAPTVPSACGEELRQETHRPEYQQEHLGLAWIDAVRIDDSDDPHDAGHDREPKKSPAHANSQDAGNGCSSHFVFLLSSLCFLGMSSGSLSPRPEWAMSLSRRLIRVSSFLALTIHQVTTLR